MDAYRIQSKIKSKVRELESERSDARSRLRTTERQSSQLHREREGLYVQLAQFYLPEMEAGQIQDTISGIQNRVEFIFKRKLQRQEEIDRLISDSSQARSILEEELEVLVKETDEKEIRMEELREATANSLSENQEYQDLHAQAKKANARLERTKKRAGAFTDIKEKRTRSYRRNRLFEYLNDRKYGTEHYLASGLVRKMDNLVAKVVNYERLKKNSEEMGTAHYEMQKVVEQRQTDLDLLVQQIASIEEETSLEMGLIGATEEYRAKVLAKDNKNSEVEQNNQAFVRYTAEDKQLEDTQGRYYGEAIQEILKLLKNESMHKLKERARDTQSPRDDKIVDRIEEIDGMTEGIENRIKDLRKDQYKLDEQISGLESIKRKITYNSFDSSRSYFDHFNMDALLVGYLAGRESSSSVWRTIDRNHHERPRPSYQSSSSYSSPSSFSSGSGFGGGGFSSGGGFGGGGFSSGSGF